MKNPLAKKYTAFGLLRFTLPTIVMMVFMSLYTMVDGVFVSRFIGTTALSAVNIVFPVVSLVVAVGVMLATGASAVVATKMGEGKNRRAMENFTFITLVAIAAGLLILAAGQLFLAPLLRVLGANADVWQYCWDYARMLLWFTPLAILQMVFQYFFVVAGKPGLGLAATVAGGVANIALDWAFIVPGGMGVAGAALATGIGYAIPALFGLFYFAFKRGGSLRFVRPKWDGPALLHSCTNGASEMVTNLSMAVTTLLFNQLMMRYLGPDGVAAITIVLYAQYLLTSIFLGYSSGVGPLISYNHGSGDTDTLKRLFKISMGFILLTSLAVFALSLLLRHQIVSVFAPAGGPVYALAIHGFLLFSLCYLFMGLNIFSSALFTALSNGKVSAIISFLRTFVLLVAFLLLLPLAWGVDGIWLAIPLAELAGVLISLGFLAGKRRVYQYA